MKRRNTRLAGLMMASVSILAIFPLGCVDDIYRTMQCVGAPDEPPPNLTYSCFGEVLLTGDVGRKFVGPWSIQTASNVEEDAKPQAVIVAEATLCYRARLEDPSGTMGKNCTPLKSSIICGVVHTDKVPHRCSNDEGVGGGTIGNPPPPQPAVIDGELEEARNAYFDLLSVADGEDTQELVQARNEYGRLLALTL